MDSPFNPIALFYRRNLASDIGWFGVPCDPSETKVLNGHKIMDGKTGRTKVARAFVGFTSPLLLACKLDRAHTPLLKAEGNKIRRAHRSSSQKENA